MKTLKSILIPAAVCGLALFSCYSPLPEGAVELPGVQHVPYTGTFSYTVSVDSGSKDVYFVFTNPSTTEDSAGGLQVSSNVIRIDGAAIPAPSPQPLHARNSAPRTAEEWMEERNRTAFAVRGAAPRTSASSFGAPLLDTVGQTISMYDIGAGYADVLKGSTCRFVSDPAVTIADSTTRTLNVWVANNCLLPALGGTGVIGTDAGEKRHLVDQTMVEALASKFLTTGLNNDIYDWVTGVIGTEWGAHEFSGVCIPPNAEITILLADILEDNSDTGGIVGYFWNGNNMTTAVASSSNQRIMFVIDAVMYANANDDGSSSVGGGTWAETDYWAEECFSTLAHEFQHMIEFYQKQVLAIRNLNASTDDWINEMCSLIMEDLLAEKLGIMGPRGVAAADQTAGASGNVQGRIPLYNYYTNGPLAIADNYDQLVYYSITYSFGAWLARAYGGAEIVRSIVTSSGTDAGAILAAITDVTGGSETFAGLMDKWSASVLLSDSTAAPAGYRYNAGQWVSSTAGGTTYNLGSINLFNYYQVDTSSAVHGLGPRTFTSTRNLPAGVPYYSSNLFYRAAEALSGSRTWNITLPADVVMSVVLK